MCDRTIGDDEILLRRIPPGSRWFEPPDRITSANFKLRPNDLGLSVYRRKIVSPEEVLQKPEAIAGSFVVQATAGDIRKLTDGNGKPLNLDVVAVADENDPGHAEIRGPAPGRCSQSTSNALRRLFKPV